MKKLITIIATAGILATSCSDFLTEIPKDEIAPSQFFKNSDHAYNAVNALYRSGLPSLFSGGVYSGSRIMFGAYTSGLVDNEYKGQEVHVQHAQQLTLNPVNMSSYLGGIWRDLYLGISRANNAVKYIPTTPGLPETEANKLLAEARFFRALNYYYLVRFFGGVPLITEPYESLENLYVERASVGDVYTLIVEDLQYASQEGNLPNTTMGSNGNRITQGAATSLLAEVYLTMSGYPLQADHYADAAQQARSLISDGVFNLTQHDRNGAGAVIPAASAYNKARLADNLQNEHIYYFEYTVGIANSGYAQWAFPTNISPELEYAIANNAYAPTPSLLAAYDPAEDLRGQEKQYFHSSFTKADGTVVNFQKAPYLWYDEEAAFETATSDKDLPIYTYANVLLIAAESIALSEGVTAEAVDYLSQVRARAYWKQSAEQIKAQLTGLTPQQFVAEVWKERLRELIFEFHVWFDIQRTRQFPVTDDGEITFVDVVGHRNSFGATYAEKHLLYPIPDDEIQRNPALDPNPGYSETD
ncbi:RagB/SusD family nutrient uptake outer membrane protein [Parapedobacter indicus]|uniref:Starch-binding associating with outer membrane n=1 Tax=Parapedobacter indicus TaxID=1477437 RepID=A0A1I3PF19_9SPHI|nr:RagB/SusD family nutrient uptake outer membrane protein [Parapedobacter indicus]PPL00430.1 putative outer membrane starch-binding protein [Parapedobacter indicus]SFJ19947.1 Starch-binding associating with outer membrane [Parapedobacter indicus]